jgi:tape measure domain-containing protein
MDKFGGLLGPVGRSVLGLGAGVVGLAGGFGALVVATAKQQEEFALLEARLKNGYGSSAAAADAFAKITALADRNAVSISGTAESFLRLARNNEAIGLARNQMVDLTDAVQKLGRVSGASTGELASGMLQFSQALASGKLNGDELRSIMENMPALAKAIADGLGVSVGQIRAMGAEGQLTSDKIVGSLLKQLPKIDAEFKGLPETSEQAFTRVANAWDRLIAGMGKTLNSSSILTKVANIGAGIVNAAADAATPETSADRFQRMLAARQGFVDVEVSNWQIGTVQRRNNRGILQAPDYSRIQRQGVGTAEDPQAEGIFYTEQLRSIANEDKIRGRASFTRSGSIVQELDSIETRSKNIKEQIATLQKANEDFLAQPFLFEPQEVERLLPEEPRRRAGRYPEIRQRRRGQHRLRGARARQQERRSGRLDHRTAGDQRDPEGALAGDRQDDRRYERRDRGAAPARLGRRAGHRGRARGRGADQGLQSPAPARR